VEKEQYLTWKRGERLQDFDKDTCREPLDKWPGAMSRLDKWVMGLRAMYLDDTLGREHAIWFAVNADFMVPTIMAHVRVLQAGKSMVDQHGILRPEQMAEYQTARRILANTSFRVQQIKQDQQLDAGDWACRGGDSDACSPLPAKSRHLGCSMMMCPVFVGCCREIR